MNALQAGAQQMRFGSSPSSDWRSMDSAPRDGTVVEVMCTYGVAPWYGLYKWNGTGWYKAGDDRIGVGSESSLKWRPYHGDVTAYRDPTGGMQNDMAYWRGAVAAKHGLPLDHFEKDVAKREASDKPKWWQFWK